MFESTTHYSSLSSDYSKYRPKYPEELYAFILSNVKEKHLAWDCGTGTGQAAVALSKHFERVFATDLSKEQISCAEQRLNIEYKVEPAEKCTLNDDSADLVTVSTALHWFNKAEFYPEVQRVLKKNGILAVWGYGLPSLQGVLEVFSSEINSNLLVSESFKGNHKNVLEQYKCLDFPFEEIKFSTEFICSQEWTLDHFLDFYDKTTFLGKEYLKDKGHPVSQLVREELTLKWGDLTQKKSVLFPLALRVARNDKRLIRS